MNILLSICQLHFLTSIAMGKEIPIDRELPPTDENLREKCIQTSPDVKEGEGNSEICANNRCMLRLNSNFDKLQDIFQTRRLLRREIRGNAEFCYTENYRILFGEMSLQYNNIEENHEKIFGFRIIIQYEKGKDVTVRLSAFYSNGAGRMETRGVNVQRLLIPSICLIDLTPIPLFKICLKVTRVVIHKEDRLEICISVRLQISMIGIYNFYIKCMNFTTSPVIDEVGKVINNFPSIRESPKKQQSMVVENPNKSEDKNAIVVTKTSNFASGENSQKKLSEVREQNLPEDENNKAVSDSTINDFDIPVERTELVESN